MLKVEEWTTALSMELYTASDTAAELSMAPTGTIATRQRLGDGDDVRGDAELLVAEEGARPPETGLHLVEDHERLVPAAERLRLLPELVRRQVDPLALDRLGDERRHVAAPELPRQGGGVTERDHVAPREQGAEAAAELLPAVEGERPRREPVEGVVAVEDARALRGGPGELDGALDRLGPGVGEEHPLDPRVRPGHQLLGQDAREQGAVHLHEVGQVGVEGVVERTNDRWMAPSEGEHPEAGQEVEVAIPLVVDEVAALALLVEPVELDLAEDPGELGVDVLRVEGEVLTLALVQHLLQIKGHAEGSRGSLSGGGDRLVVTPRPDTNHGPASP